MPAMMPLSGDFKAILSRKRDSRYSLRAFARELKLSPSRLSEILSGKQGLSRNAARSIATQLGYGTKEIDLFCDLVDSQHARAKVNRELAKIRLDKRKSDPEHLLLREDTFKLIADWHHFAILQLTELKGFKSDPQWIANALGVTLLDVTDALRRLERLGMIESHRGRIRATQSTTRTTDDVPSEAIRKAHRQILERASLALSTQPVEQREISANIIPMNQKQLEEAKRWLRSFRRRFAQRLAAADEKDRVYCLGIQFFNLTQL